MFHKILKKKEKFCNLSDFVLLSIIFRIEYPVKCGKCAMNKQLKFLKSERKFKFTLYMP